MRVESGSSLIAAARARPLLVNVNACSSAAGQTRRGKVLQVRMSGLRSDYGRMVGFRVGFREKCRKVACRSHGWARTCKHVPKQVRRGRRFKSDQWLSELFSIPCPACLSWQAFVMWHLWCPAGSLGRGSPRPPVGRPTAPSPAGTIRIWEGHAEAGANRRTLPRQMPGGCRVWPRPAMRHH